MSATAKQLANGEYWVTFTIGDSEPQRRRVVVVPDARGVQRMRWANDQWKPYPPSAPSDVGVRVDQLPESTLFEPRELAVSRDECSQVANDRVTDSDGRPLSVGTYELYQRGVLASTLVNVEEDPLSGDLVAVFGNSGGTRSRVEDMQADERFSWQRI